MRGTLFGDKQSLGSKTASRYLYTRTFECEFCHEVVYKESTSKSGLHKMRFCSPACSQKWLGLNRSGRLDLCPSKKEPLEKLLATI